MRLKNRSLYNCVVDRDGIVLASTNPEPGFVLPQKAFLTQQPREMRCAARGAMLTWHISCIKLIRGKAPDNEELAPVSNFECLASLRVCFA